MSDFAFLAKLNHSKRKLFLERLKTEWTYTSNSLEGNTLSLGETQFIIEYGITVKGKPIAEHNEVIGHARAIDLLYHLLDRSVIDEANVFLLHKALQDNVVADIYSPIGAWKNEANGRYIRIGEKLEYRAYPEPRDIPHLMGLWFVMFADAIETINAENRMYHYTALHLAFTSIHPFFDGNGRMARLLANIPLLKAGFLPCVVQSEDRAEYLACLQSCDLESMSLDRSSHKLINENKPFDVLHAFFSRQYQSSQALLDEIVNA